MTEFPGPGRRMTNALVISVCLHLLLIVSVASGYSGKTGTFSIPGVMTVELVTGGGDNAPLNAATEPTPFPAPALNPAAPAGPLPSLNNSASDGDQRTPSTARDDSDQLSGGDQPGVHTGASGINPRRPPAVGPGTPPPDATGSIGPGRRPGPNPPAPAEINPEPSCAACPDPPYPDLARRRGIEGEVLLSVQVLPDGRVGDIFVVKSSGFPFLDDAALSAVKGYSFFPATDESGPVAATIPFPVRFKLSEQ